ncbi:hypothetical protein EYC84_006505 [Monilinia fructicola]|uniref:Uncharacterized protein n=1 Tax=Monilinia fructicola TaxID=38448 RepID=A0A5M9K3K3_MONFR|nr:hypothetical protein EYC84_006505 [Monilinia fructicola]
MGREGTTHWHLAFGTLIKLQETYQIIKKKIKKVTWLSLRFTHAPSTILVETQPLRLMLSRDWSPPCHCPIWCFHWYVHRPHTRKNIRLMGIAHQVNMRPLSSVMETRTSGWKGCHQGCRQCQRYHWPSSYQGEH